MKKKITVMIALLCIMSMLVAFAGCSVKNDDAPVGETGSGQQSDNISSGDLSDNVSSGSPSGEEAGASEIQQLRIVMSAVLNEFSGRLNNNVFASMLLTGSDVSGEFEKSDALEEIYDYMDTVEDKEIIEEKLMNEIALRNFVAVLAYGELINKLCDTDKIYGVPIELDMGNDASPSTAYAIILSEGTHIVVYLYGRDDTTGEMVYKFDVDYVSDSEFSAKMMTLAMPQLDSDDTQNAFAYYFYGDTDGRVLCGSYGGNDEDSALNYKKADSDVCYSVVNSDAIRQGLSKVKPEYDGIDLDLIRSLEESCKCSASYQQYSEIVDKICEQYGLD